MEQNKNKTNRMILVQTCNCTSPNFKDLITRNWNILHTNQEFEHIFSELPLLAYRRNKNLSRFSRKQEQS